MLCAKNCKKGETMYYRHNLNYEYPARSDEHMIKVKHQRDTHFDENYQYLKKGFWHKFKRFLLQITLWCLAFPACAIRHGVKIHGRKKMRKYLKEFKDGAITVSNHVFMWDYLCVLMAICPKLQYFPAWKTNFEGPNGPLIHWVGGIPVPTDNFRAMVKFQKAMDEVLQTGKWMHVFPEGSMWFYYPDIRPLKKAVFKYSAKYNKPIIPITMSFRPRKGIAKLWGEAPFVDVNIGDPLYPDTSLSMLEAAEKLHKEAYHVMQGMNGIHPGDPTYNVNQNIETYQKTM